MRRAQLLLETTKTPIDAVAYGVGYRSTNTFRDHFTTVVGATPTAYRRSFSERR
ncbi:MAG: helix-turn-helix domain-containing protein [Actinomycetota bacterium]